MGELLDQDLERYPVLQGQRDGGGEGVHQPGDGAPFLGHHQEDLARSSVRIDADRDVALVALDVELVGDGPALVGQLAANRPGLLGEGHHLRQDGHGGRLDLLLVQGGVQRLRALGSIPVDRDRLEAHPPALQIDLADLLGRGVLRHVHRLGDRPGDERLAGGHHLHVAHVVDRP